MSYLKILFFIVLFFGFSLQADTIYLKNGNKLEGKVTKIDKTSVVIQMAFGKISVPKKNIDSIEKDEDVDIIIRQIERLLSLGAREHALRYMEKVIREYPDEPLLQEAIADAYYQCGKTYLKNEQFSLAFRTLKKAQKYNPYLDISEALAKIKKSQKWALGYKAKGDKFFQAKQYEKAVDAYLTAIKNYPDIVEHVSSPLAIASLNLGNKKFRAKEYPSALGRYNTALEYKPELFPYMEKQWLFANVQKISQTHFPKKQWNSAITELELILKTTPTYLPALYMTGVAFENKGLYNKSFYYYKRVLNERKMWDGTPSQLERFRLRAYKQSGAGFLGINSLEALVETPSSGRWQQIKTPHFQIFHQNENIAKRIAYSLEHHFRLVGSRLAPKNWREKWPMLCQVYVYPTKKSYTAKTGTPPWSEGVAKLEYYSGTLQKQGIYLYSSAPLLFSNILPHELTHVLYPWFLKYRVRLPLWLNEGIAMTSETGFRLINRKRVIKNAVRKGKHFPLKKFFAMQGYPENDKQVDVFYSQSFSVVGYLLEIGNSNQLLQFAQTSNVSQALTKIYRIPNIDVLERQWLAYVQKK